MNKSSVIHYNQEYSCGKGKAKVNLYNGALGFAYPLISVGNNTFQLTSTLVYNFNYNSTDFNEMKIGFNNGWKLNIHQYVFPYVTSYNIEGFEMGDYVYIDANWNIHKFVKYKENIDNEEYYDNDGTGLKLYIYNDSKKIVDQYNNQYIFDDAGKMVETISGVNGGIKKKIEYVDENLTTLYDVRRPERKLKFTYNLDKTLKKAYTTVNNIGYEFEYNNLNLSKIIKFCETKSKDVLEFKYTWSNEIENVINSTNLEGLEFTYQANKVIKVCYEAVEKAPITKELSSSIYVGDSIMCGEENYLIKGGSNLVGYSLSMPSELLKEEVCIKYKDSYTEITNNQGIVINYYFNRDGKLISCLESKNGNLFTTSRSKGWRLSNGGTSNQKLNGLALNLLNVSNNYTYTVDNNLMEEFKNIFKDNKKEEFSEHFSLSFWMSFKNNNKSNLKATLKYILDETTTTTSVKMEKTNVGVWQQVVIPVNLGLNQSKLSSITLEFNGCDKNTVIQIADVRIMKGGVPEVYIFKNEETGYKEFKLAMGTKINYATNAILKSQTISPEFYLTENDVFLTYKSLFNSKQTGQQSFDLVYNDGTKVISVTYVGINDDTTYYFRIDDEDIPNYYFKLIDIIEKGKYAITEKQIRFHYDSQIKKYYYETKTMMKVVDNQNVLHNRLSDNDAYITYSWQNDDGTFRAQKDINKVITENFYDEYGNTLSIETFKENSKEEESIKTIYTYDTTNPNQREKVMSCSKNGIIIKYNYEEDDALKEIIEGKKATSYKKDIYDENILAVNIKDNETTLQKNNVINYNAKGSIKWIKNSEDAVYGFRYNIYNELEKVYKNKELIYEVKKENETNVIEKTYQVEDIPSITNYIYDEQGKLIQYINGNNKISFNYQNDNLNVSTILNRLIEITDEFSGDTYHFTYEDKDSISEKTVIDNKLTYEVIDNKTMNYQIKNEKLITYRTLNSSILSSNIESIIHYYVDTETLEEKLHEDFTFVYKYDDCGRISEKNGIATVYNNTLSVKTDKLITYHHGTNLPKKILYETTSSSQSDQDSVEFYYENINYDVQGNITNIIEAGNRYKENPKNTSLREKVNLPTRCYSYTYDNYNRLIGEANPEFGNLTYDYDSKGGMLKQIKKNNKIIKTFTYESGLLTEINNSDKIKKINYDYYGNMLNDEKATFTYNSRNLLESYTCNKTNNSKYIEQYSYNYQGIRYKKECQEENSGITTHIKTINYYLKENTILGEDWTDNNGNVTKKLRYYYDIEGICGIRYDGYNFTLIKDSLGNVSKVMYKGKVIGEYVYDAWGNSKVVELSVSNDRDRFVLYNNPFRYKGYYLDVETELYLVSSRYYSPELCRWISPDSIEYLDPSSINGLNLYVYANNNPIVREKLSCATNTDVFNRLNTNTIHLPMNLLKVDSNKMNKNYWNPHWKNKWLDTDMPRFFILTNEGFEVINWGLSIYKGSLYFDNNKNNSIYISAGNISVYAGVNYKKGIGLDASANVLEIGFDSKIIDANVEGLSIGFTYMYKDGELKFKYGYGWWGWSVSIDFVELFKWLFGGE